MFVEAPSSFFVHVHGGGWSAGDKSEMNDFKNFVREQHPNLGVVT